MTPAEIAALRARILNAPGLDEFERGYQLAKLEATTERDRLAAALEETRDVLWRIANGPLGTARADAADEWNRLTTLKGTR